MTGVAVAIMGLVLIASYVLMWRGWRRRVRAQVALPPLPPATSTEAVHAWIDAVYAGTTMAGDWMERVVAYGLGRRSPASIAVTPAGVQLERGTEPSFSIPASSLHAVRIDRAGAGRAVRRAEYVIITWEHGDTMLDTAVRPRHRDDRGRLHEAVAALGATERGTGDTPSVRTIRHKESE